MAGIRRPRRGFTAKAEPVPPRRRTGGGANALRRQIDAQQLCGRIHRASDRTLQPRLGGTVDAPQLRLLHCTRASSRPIHIADPDARLLKGSRPQTAAMRGESSRQTCTPRGLLRTPSRPVHTLFRGVRLPRDSRPPPAAISARPTRLLQAAKIRDRHASCGQMGAVSRGRCRIYSWSGNNGPSGHRVLGVPLASAPGL